MADSAVGLNSFRTMGLTSGKGFKTPVKASEVIEPGTLVIITAGYALDGSNSASSVFGGVSAEKEIITGGAADGDVMIRLHRRGIFAFGAASSAATDLGKQVYLADNSNYVVAAPGTGDILIGRVVGWDTTDGLWVSGAKALIKIDSFC